MGGKRATVLGSETARYVDVEQLQGPNTMDDLFMILSNSRRRFVLSYLCEQDEPTEVSELAKQTEAHESDVDVEDVDSKQYRSVYTTLYQNHLLMLDSAGLVDYDEDAMTVELTQYTRKAVVEKPIPSEDRSWYRYYGTVTVAGGVLAGVAKLVITSALSALLTVGALLGVFTMVALSSVHYVSDAGTLDDSRYVRMDALV